MKSSRTTLVPFGGPLSGTVGTPRRRLLITIRAPGSAAIQISATTGEAEGGLCLRPLVGDDDPGKARLPKVHRKWQLVGMQSG